MIEKSLIDEFMEEVRAGTFGRKKNGKYWSIGHPIDQLIEECSEVIHALCKCRRFGWHNYHPNDPDKAKNFNLVLSEIDDLEARLVEFKQWVNVHKPRSEF